jgi:hypothetical protein
MSKILARSPYWINATATGLINASIELWVYAGNRETARPSTPNYTITSTVTDTPNKVYWDISDLVKDFIVADKFDTSLDVVWVDYRITKTTETGTTVGSIQSGDYAVYGYSYYEEGYNATSLNACLIDNDTIYKLADNNVKIPVDMKLMESIAFLNGDDLLYSVPNDPSSVNNSISIMKDYGLGGFSPYAYSNFEHRVSVNGGVFETNKCIEAFLAEEEIYPITKVVIASTDAPLKTITVENIEECKYTPYKLTFRNKLGGQQELWFFKASRLSMEVQREQYQGNTIKDYRAGNISRHRNADFYTTSKETLTINSGFVPEEFNEAFKQLMLSEQVWIDYKGKTLPINVSNQTIDYKTKLNNKLINYTIDVEFSFNTTNNVR